MDEAAAMPTTMTAQPEASQCTAPSQPDGGAATVLLAEDDAASRRLIEAFLNRGGYRVLIAEDGKQALEVLEQTTPDLVLLDRKMPKLDGMAVCRWIQANSRLVDVPVVFLTALTDPVASAEGFAVGGVDYVRKPVVGVELLARIRNHIELARSRQRLRARVERLSHRVQDQRGRLGQVRDGQESLLTDPARFSDIDLVVRFQPAGEAGGDFYELVRLSDDVLGFLVADVSGHDLSSTYITGALKALTATFTSECLSVDETMLMLNAGLYKFLDESQYVTAAYAKFYRSEMQLELVCAGHPAPLYQARDGEPEYLDLIGDALGMCEHAHFASKRLTVKSGDRLWLFTDGLIESFPDADGQLGNRLWGMEQLASRLGGRRTAPITEAVTSTVGELLDARQGSLDDDIVVIGVEL